MSFPYLYFTRIKYPVAINLTINIDRQHIERDIEHVTAVLKVV